jgi:hypothetical protein
MLVHPLSQSLLSLAPSLQDASDRAITATSQSCYASEQLNKISKNRAAFCDAYDGLVARSQIIECATQWSASRLPSTGLVDKIFTHSQIIDSISCWEALMFARMLVYLRTCFRAFFLHYVSMYNGVQQDSTGGITSWWSNDREDYQVSLVLFGVVLQLFMVFS